MARVGPEHRCSRIAQAIVVALMFSSFGVAQGKDEGILVDRLVAEVNGEAVTYSEVLAKVEKKNLVEVGAFPAKDTDPPFTIALQDLINKKLIIQKVDEAGIEVSDEGVEQEIKGFLRKKGLTQQGLLDALKAEGLDYDQYFADFKNQMLIKQFQGRFIVPSVKISEKDIELFYFRMLGSSPEGVNLKLRQLFIEIDPAAPEGVRKAKTALAATVHKKLTEGMDFESAVKIYSNAPGASESGGSMPSLSLKDLSPEIRGAVEPLKKGEFSQPVKVGNGLYMFYLEKKFLSDTRDFEKKRRELEFRLRQQEMERETLRWLEIQRNQSKIRVIADEG